MSAPRRPAAPPYHTRTWLVWVAAATLAAGATRNPLYLVIVLLVARVVAEAVGVWHGPADGTDPRRRGWGTFVRVSVVIAGFSALFNFLAAHIGSTVVVRLPAEWPLVGGPLTVEGLVYGLLNGLTLITLLAVFATFNTGADPYALLRTIPAGFAQAGLITAIAVAYVPQTLARWGEIREAQTLRGHRVRGVGDLLPLAVPLLTGGLERAIALAEAMEARGFAAEGATARADRVPRFALAGGLLAVFLGGVLSLYFARQPLGGAVIAGAGVLLVVGTVVRAARQGSRTHYRRETWHRRDTLVSAVLVGTALVIVVLVITRPQVWAYTPYLTLGWPPFDPLLGGLLLALVAPALPLMVATAQPVQKPMLHD